MTDSPEITGRLLAGVDAILHSAGVTRVHNSSLGGLNSSVEGLAAVYEDTQSFIGVASFTTVGGLLDGWLQAQEDLALITSNSRGTLGAKAWDGYLVLLCAQAIPESEVASVTAIRSNTRRLRKLVVALTDDSLAATSVAPERLSSLLRRELAPLLPLAIRRDAGFEDPIARLPQRVTAPGITPFDVKAVLDAYDAGSPMVVALHERRFKSGGL